MAEVVKGGFLGEKWDSSWSHMMGEIWICGEKGAGRDRALKKHKSRKAQSMFEARRSWPAKEHDESEKERHRESGSSQGKLFFFFLPFLLKF